MNKSNIVFKYFFLLKNAHGGCYPHIITSFHNIQLLSTFDYLTKCVKKRTVAILHFQLFQKFGIIDFRTQRVCCQKQIQVFKVLLNPCFKLQHRTFIKSSCHTWFFPVEIFNTIKIKNKPIKKNTYDQTHN